MPFFSPPVSASALPLESQVETDLLGVSSGRSEIMRYSNHWLESPMALRRALLGTKMVSVISGSSVRMANVLSSKLVSVTLVNPYRKKSTKEQTAKTAVHIPNHNAFL